MRNSCEQLSRACVAHTSSCFEFQIYFTSESESLWQIEHVLHSASRVHIGVCAHEPCPSLPDNYVDAAPALARWSDVLENAIVNSSTHSMSNFLKQRAATHQLPAGRHPHPRR